MQAAAAIRSGGLDEQDSIAGITLDVWAMLGAGLTVAATPVPLVLAYPVRWFFRPVRRSLGLLQPPRDPR